MSTRIGLVFSLWMSLLAANALAAVGRTAGQFAVSPLGSAQYSIPIWTPPGIRGVQPKLALSYDSHLSYGIMGPGWTISGLSVIARCNPTFAQDGTPAPITLTTADGLCLDGNRLRTTGTGTYQTEIANFSNVTASGTAGNGPSYFTVQGKDGLTYEYGNTTDSKILPSGGSTPYIWALDKVTDRAGNQMTFTYYQNGGAYVPLSIQYTAPSGSSSFPYQVNFGYTTKSAVDTLSKYIAGTSIQQTQQLGTITVSGSGTTVRKYALTYTTASQTGRATLTSIQECGGSAGTDCLYATTIGYQAGTAGIANPSTSSGNGYTDGPVYSVDIDGDGRKDLVFGVFNRNAHYYNWYVQLSTPTGYGPAINTGGVDTGVLLDDLDATGLTDIVLSGSIFKWNGSGFTKTTLNVSPPIGSSLSFADIDGDGRPDLVALTINGSSSKLAVYLNTTTSTELAPLLETPG